MDNNKVSVKIYGQEYVIAGDTPRQRIVKIAAYVDNKMHEINEVMSPGPASSLAVLSAVNICDELFDAQEQAEELEKQNAQLQKDVQHYVQLWDEAKKTYIEQKEEGQVIIQQKDELQRQLSDKDKEIRNMKDQVQAADKEAEEKAAASVHELEEKCRELENSFFDIQMENIQLKKELGTYRRDSED